MAEKVVVTGMGLVTPLGQGIEPNWQTLQSPKTTITHQWGQSPQTNITHLRGLSPEVCLNGFLMAKDLAEAPALEALRESGLWEGESLQGVDPERTGCTVSASKPLFDGNTPYSPDVINDFIVRRFGLQGESRNVIAACATGAYSIAVAASWIEQGLCDVVLAGSVEPYPHPLIEAGFRQMGVMSPEGITRPFDRDRRGFNFGEGAGIVVLESSDHASNRGAKTLGRLSGWALGCDSHSAVAFNSGGAKISNVIERALERSGLSSPAVRHVNAHGTGTRLNDWIETQALIKAFGPDAQKLMISATKASTGHLLGASGSVEFIFTVLALARQYVPPTATLETPDAECPLDYTPRQGHTASFEHALSLSFGFGGSIGALVVSAC